MLFFCMLIASIELHKMILFIQFIQFDFVHFGFYCPPKNGIHHKAMISLIWEEYERCWGRKSFWKAGP